MILIYKLIVGDFTIRRNLMRTFEMFADHPSILKKNSVPKHAF